MAVHALEDLGMLAACRLRGPELWCGHIIANGTFCVRGKWNVQESGRMGSTFHSWHFTWDIRFYSLNYTPQRNRNTPENAQRESDQAGMGLENITTTVGSGCFAPISILPCSRKHSISLAMSHGWGHPPEEGVWPRPDHSTICPFLDTGTGSGVDMWHKLSQRRSYPCFFLDLLGKKNSFSVAFAESAKSYRIRSACLGMMSMQRKTEPAYGDWLLRTLLEPLCPIVSNPGSCQFHESINSL